MTSTKANGTAPAHAPAPTHGIADPGAYGWGVFHERHPALVRRLCEGNPYGPEQRARLDALLDESRTGRVRPPAPETAAAAPWAARDRRYFGRPWSEVPFLWAESYFYLRLLECVDHFSPGPWQGVDPFAPMKNAELTDPALESDTAWLDGLAGAPPDEAFRALVLASLYGNRADLGFQLVQAVTTPTDGDPTDGDPTGGDPTGGDPTGGDPTGGDPTGGDPVADGPGASGAPLLADDAEALWKHVSRRPPGDVHVILDNAGRELLADLLLMDHLLTTGRATSVVLHVKPRPYYVSDATASDVRDCLTRMAAFRGEAGRAAGRLREAAATGRLRQATHAFFCSPVEFADMPADLRAGLAQAGLCVYKGDLNYRRLVGDRAWPADRPFDDAVAGVPGSLVALRTLKSEVAVGLPKETVDRLDAARPDWRTDGSQALVQTRLRP
ncbi:protein-glutamate O-methyltransferase family protein [Streptomyces mobaraensis NBRC 13819 = DSM 40847]|uniref:damage-control phosphatase ARMT1 family protein n=1 Tax=Streptomyces mobaraensis TaxID=35621 RepID=UPI001B3081FA|nr:damage-control phosphatase ARMT1 family protein [Streptomyces mobaraensis]QTT75122.1 protein-glutamate O-methyltransferase family protein [Streptomyces mobaraensis NBRC 13819 = DSM 40847]